ncbi:dipeptidase [Virgibacillus litoralis]|uniref:Membrane dipeptidase n=1 Tax=Virgibacillus litoralis TaxID=578221 RepID=A0ABS4HBV3_9BACI|nr:membrane dipeptidase [Virgibacillus litoralis]
MNVIDLHSDIFTDIAFRREKGERNVLERRHLPYLKKAGVSGIIGAFWVEPLFKDNKKARFQELVRFALDDIKESERIKIITSPKRLLETVRDDQFFVFLGIEGLAFLEEWGGNIDENMIDEAFHELNQKSIRHSILAWYDSNFLASASGNNNHTGLTTLGKYTIKQHEKNNWIIDVSHLDEETFWGVINASNMPILASHSNVRKICDSERNLTDQQIEAIAATGGLIGVNACSAFVHKEDPTLSKVIDHISYIADLVGIEHVGFGFDFVDYLEPYKLAGATPNMTTEGLENATKIPDLLNEMVKRGFSTEEVEQVAFTNFYQFLCKIHFSKKLGGNIYE